MMEEITNGNKVFSDDKKYKTKPDFQTEHMKNKIKNIKKKKKMLNIQNIEPLVNIHEMPQDNSKEPIIEGLNFNPITTFKDDDWTGNDNIYEGGNKTNKSVESLADKIEKLYTKMKDAYDRFVYKITKGLSGSEFFNEDVKYVKTYLNWMLSIIVASFAVYNWVFLMFFKHNHSKDSDGTKVPVWKTPRDYIHNNASLNPFFWILDKFTNIPLFFPEYFKIAMITWLPQFITSNIDKNGLSKIVLILLFMYMLVLFTFLLHNSPDLIKNLLVNIAKFNFEGILTTFIYITTCVLFLMSFIETNPIAAILPIGGFISFVKFMNPLFWIEKIAIFIYLFFVGVPISVALCLCYIVSYTVGGILLYKDGKSMMEIKQLIDKFFDIYKPEPRRDTPCNPLSFFDKTINYMVMIFNYIYDNCIKLGFLAVMVYALIDSGINIKSNPLKLVTMLISIASILLVAIHGILSFIKGEPTQDDTVDIVNNIISNVDPPINANINRVNPIAKTTLSNIVENLNVNDNEKIKDGLKQGLNMFANQQPT
jgi:hypothetical protein